MALASFDLMKRTGTSPGSDNDTSWNPCFLSIDSHSTDTGSYAIPVPSSGIEYSYENWLRLKCDSAPDNAVSNIKWWFTSDDPATGIEIYVGTTATYATPVDTSSTTATTDATTYYDAGSALTWGTPQTDDEINSVNDYTDYLVMQLQVDTTAGQGDVQTMVMHFQYDES